LKERLALALGLVLLGVPAFPQALPPSEAYKLRVEFYEWRPNLTGDVQQGSTTFDGSLIDLKSDLAFADPHTFEIQGTLQLSPGQKLRGSYTKINYSGATFAPRTLLFGSSVYPTQTSVNSTMTGGYYSAAYEWDFAKSSQGYFGVLLGGRLMSVTTTLLDPSLVVSSAASMTAPTPIVGLAGRIYAGKLSLSGDASGLTIGSRGSGYELNGAAQFHVSDRLAVEGGYRYYQIQGRQGLSFLDIHQAGWHFGAELSL
jgi:opacity protein-like surface antigen